MGTEPMGDLVAIDGRDLAIVITITRDGMADARAPHCSKKQAAIWLRNIADVWDPAEVQS